MIRNHVESPGTGTTLAVALSLVVASLTLTMGSAGAVTTEGTVTAVTGSGYYLQNGTGRFSGVFVFTGGSPSVGPGDVVNLTAPVEENFGLTRLNLNQSGASANVTGSAPVPGATALDTGEVGQEAYEGVLVNVSNATEIGRAHV